jgi:hypothetical protein
MDSGVVRTSTRGETLAEYLKRIGKAHPAQPVKFPFSKRSYFNQS